MNDDWTFSGEVIYWRGPSPFHFVATTDDVSADIHEIAPEVTYGWGVIPVSIEIGSTTFTTSLFPKDGGYLVPIKAIVRKAEGLDIGDVITLRLTIVHGGVRP